MSRFTAIKLDRCDLPAYSGHMEQNATSPTAPGRIAGFIRQRIERGGERLWREGTIERLSKGVYYRTRETSFGKSRPNPADIQKLASNKRRTVFPSGIAAANLLGFSTQTARRGEV